MTSDNTVSAQSGEAGGQTEEPDRPQEEAQAARPDLGDRERECDRGELTQPLIGQLQIYKAFYWSIVNYMASHWSIVNYKATHWLVVI